MQANDIPDDIWRAMQGKDDEEREDERRAVHRHRTIWISDTHLGTPGCQAAYLLDFLRHNDCETLYLVGDIIDGWQLRRGWYWHQSHNDVVQKVLRKARKGTRVVFVPGNHDAFARQFIGLAFGDIEVCDEAIHVTADGRRLWVTHGDQFDGVVQNAKWLAHLGDTLYTWALGLNRWFNRLRSRLGLRYWSLSQYLKHRVKNAVAFIADFEGVLAGEARRRGFDGVVCGHIHKAEIREIDGLLYCNDGDWVESLTALVESADGVLRLVTWDELRGPVAAGNGHRRTPARAARSAKAAVAPKTTVRSTADAESSATGAAPSTADTDTRSKVPA